MARQDIKQYQMFIADRWAMGSGSKVFEVENPANETVIATIPRGTKEDAATALTAARQAKSNWAQLPICQTEPDSVFEVKSDCRVLGVDNGIANLDCHQDFRLKTHRGRALLVVQANHVDSIRRISIKTQDVNLGSKVLEPKAYTPEKILKGAPHD